MSEKCFCEFLLFCHVEARNISELYGTQVKIVLRDPSFIRVTRLKYNPSVCHVEARNISELYGTQVKIVLRDPSFIRVTQLKYNPSVCHVEARNISELYGTQVKIVLRDPSCIRVTRLKHLSNLPSFSPLQSSFKTILQDGAGCST